MNICVILKNLRKNCLAKKSFIVHLTYRKKEHDHVLNVWNKFEMKAMKYYPDIMIKNSLKDYGLCRSHYLSSPSLSWNTIFKMTIIDF